MSILFRTFPASNLDHALDSKQFKTMVITNHNTENAVLSGKSVFSVFINTSFLIFLVKMKSTSQF